MPKKIILAHQQQNSSCRLNSVGLAVLIQEHLKNPSNQIQDRPVLKAYIQLLQVMDAALAQINPPELTKFKVQDGLATRWLKPNQRNALQGFLVKPGNGESQLVEALRHQFKILFRNNQNDKAQDLISRANAIRLLLSKPSSNTIPDDTEIDELITSIRGNGIQIAYAAVTRELKNNTLSSKLETVLDQSEQDFAGMNANQTNNMQGLLDNEVLQYFKKPVNLKQMGLSEFSMELEEVQHQDKHEKYIIQLLDKNNMIQITKTKPNLHSVAAGYDGRHYWVADSVGETLSGGSENATTLTFYDSFREMENDNQFLWSQNDVLNIKATKLTPKPKPLSDAELIRKEHHRAYTNLAALVYAYENCPDSDFANFLNKIENAAPGQTLPFAEGHVYVRPKTIQLGAGIDWLEAEIAAEAQRYLNSKSNKTSAEVQRVMSLPEKIKTGEIKRPAAQSTQPSSQAPTNHTLLTQELFARAKMKQVKVAMEMDESALLDDFPQAVQDHVRPMRDSGCKKAAMMTLHQDYQKDGKSPPMSLIKVKQVKGKELWTNLDALKDDLDLARITLKLDGVSCEISGTIVNNIVGLCRIKPGETTPRLISQEEMMAYQTQHGKDLGVEVMERLKAKMNNPTTHLGSQVHTRPKPSLKNS
jgi:hypothetical protein